MMPMMGGMQGGGGGGAIMIDDNDNLYVLRGGTVFKIAKRDLAIKAQTQLPGGPPPGQRMPEMRRGEMMPPGAGGREAQRPPREGNPFDDGN
jgi:hypothetical protein